MKELNPIMKRSGEGIQTLMETAFKEFGSLDILVNNAGFSENAQSEELTLYPSQLDK